jgi:hypothetical protein
VALVALVQIRGRGKLAGMTIAVTVGTELELDLVECVFSLRNVTLHALQARVPALQRIRGCRVILNAELRWFESFDGMTRRALPAVRSLCELAAVRIRLVAIHALIEGDSFLEITPSVALDTLHLRMLSEQRIFRF